MSRYTSQAFRTALAEDKRANPELYCMRKYRVHVGGKRYRYYPSVEAATPFLNDIFQRLNIVLTITLTPKRYR